LGAHVTLCAADRARFRRLFTAALCNSEQVIVYFVAAESRLVTRSPISRKPHPIPAGATLVGNYSHPFDAGNFLDDLEDVLTKIATQELSRAIGPNLAPT
jgi:hypothetical protein